MSEKKAPPMDPASILATLEHISQAIEAMTAVVGELRGYLDEHGGSAAVPEIAMDPEELEQVELAAGERTVH
jgi:hypothetical protein